MEQAGLEVRSLITKTAALLSQKTISFKDRSAVQQRRHSPATGFTYGSGLESQTGSQCACCHQEIELKYLAQWLLLAEAEVAP